MNLWGGFRSAGAVRFRVSFRYNTARRNMIVMAADTPISVGRRVLDRWWRRWWGVAIGCAIGGGDSGSGSGWRDGMIGI